ncbi:hypothetical protein [Pseudoalteromonas ardens]|uniref:Uncharacterized protein n=1 Tax=Pseudoalteromonas rubra TaxID=43658 RepID=A0A0L0ER65_9GAMM|nr:hypothetical protein [Pseudoalteromonas sp. R96]KNC66865.1 hypothetical protein AC626_14460 [Pseudoalteromonas rubra]MDK1313108.1 hypothetical protein [Pseudoalteromonas sp. R96]
MKTWTTLLLTLLATFSTLTFASVKGSTKTTVTTLITYSQYGQGDIVFKLAAPEESCADGYWMKKSDPGFDANLSALLSAYHAKSKVIARGHDDQIWAGSSGRYCLLYSIELY